MRARDALLMFAFLGVGAYGAWTWWSGRAPERAPRHATEPEISAAPDESATQGRRRALVPLETRKPAAAPAHGVPLEIAQKNSQGIERLEQGDLAGAIELFEACRAAVPGEKVFADNLAEALARSANQAFDSSDDERRSKALADMRRAHELAPGRKDVESRLAHMERLARSEAGFWKDSSEHFELSYDGERNDLLGGAFQITAALERAYQQYGELFDVWPVEKSKAKIRIVLYHRDGFHEATGIGHWAGGLFDGTVRVPVDDLAAEKRDLERVLRHEIAHAFVNASGGAGVPGWLNEGIAQYLEYEDLAARAARVEIAKKRLAGKVLLPLGDLQRSLGTLGDDDAIQSAYAEGLVLVQRLDRDFGERVPFQMVAGCARTLPVERTFHERTGQDLAGVLADLAQDLGR